MKTNKTEQKKSERTGTKKMKKTKEEEEEEEEVGKREGERCSSAWLTNTGSHQSWKMKRR